jgi:hypothetical protein
MRTRSMQREAADCRRKAAQFTGQPEETFLLHLASAWEEVALINGNHGGGRRGASSN